MLDIPGIQTPSSQIPLFFEGMIINPKTES